MSNAMCLKRTGFVTLLCAVTANSLPAQTFNLLLYFNGTDGATSCGTLVEATNGYFYGTTFGGGAYGQGTIFKMTPSGTLTTLYSFESTDGAYPFAGLVQASGRDFYGTTVYGGLSNACAFSYPGCGTVFKINQNGVHTRLYSFCSQGGSLCTDGTSPLAGLIQATNKDFYGTTNSVEPITVGRFSRSPQAAL